MLRKRILFAWELGANSGHLARDIPVAEQLRKLGHDVTFAARDLRVAQEVLAPRGFRFLQAPRPHTAGHRKQPPANYSGILLAGGYGDALNLVGSVGGWAALLDVTQTDVVVINHAPTAALAARALAIPAVITCIGFELPPNVEPLPSFRPWETRSIDELRQADATVLGNINIVLQNYSKAPYAVSPTCLANYRQYSRLSQSWTTMVTGHAHDMLARCLDYQLQQKPIGRQMTPSGYLPTCAPRCRVSSISWRHCRNPAPVFSVSLLASLKRLLTALHHRRSRYWLAPWHSGKLFPTLI